MRVFLTGVSGYFGGLLAETLARVPELEGITGIDVAEPAADLPAKVDFVRGIRLDSPRQLTCPSDLLLDPLRAGNLIGLVKPIAVERLAGLVGREAAGFGGRRLDVRSDRLGNPRAVLDSPAGFQQDLDPLR